jgi:hypothetical protein
LSQEPLDLHYGRGKMIRLGLLSIVFCAMSLLVAAGRLGSDDDYHGRGAWLVGLLGPDGMRVLCGAVAALTAVSTVAALRRAFGSLLAARADAAGVTVRTLFGSRHYAAADIAGIELRATAGQSVLLVVPKPGRGRRRGLGVRSLAEEPEEVEAWAEAVLTRLRQAPRP